MRAKGLVCHWHSGKQPSQGYGGIRRMACGDVGTGSARVGDVNTPPSPSLSL